MEIDFYNTDVVKLIMKIIYYLIKIMKKYNEKNNETNNNHINLNNNFDFDLKTFICGIKDMNLNITNVNIDRAFLNSLIDDYKITHNNFKKKFKHVSIPIL